MYASSPQRGDFMINFYRNELEKNPANIGAKNILDFYEKHKQEGMKKKDKNMDDLEHDLRSCEWIVEKCKKSETYSQNLYTALCNNEFKKINNNLLKTFENINFWSCSWRHAGGIVADLNENGDYIDWYCSGIGGQEGFFGEGFVTDEIKEDLKKLGWIVIEKK